MQIEHNVGGWPGKQPLLMRVEADSVGAFIERAQAPVGFRAKAANAGSIAETARYVEGKDFWAG